MRCAIAGWVDTGDDPVGFFDIELSADGKPPWVTNFVPRDDMTEEDLSDGNMLAP